MKIEINILIFLRVNVRGNKILKIFFLKFDKEKWLIFKLFLWIWIVVLLELYVLW